MKIANNDKSQKIYNTILKCIYTTKKIMKIKQN